VTGWAATIVAVARRPRLWLTALGQARRLAPRRWWAKAPFLPVPDRDWMAFRMETQYGDPRHPPVPGDVVTWLEWAARNRPHRTPARH
jgi:hypothetical protein